MKTNTRGAIPVLVWVAVVLLGGGAWGLSKTKLFHGESKRAATSTATTAALVNVTEDQSAKAAAVFTAIGATNSEAPDSPQKRVIGRFVPVGLSLTGAPDPAFLLEMEKLKVAELTGKLSQADKISTALLQDAAEVRRELAKAIAAKRASDLALEVAAAEARAKEQQAFWAILAALAAGALYCYVKLTHISPGALAEAVQGIRNGGETNAAIQAIDASTSRLQQLFTRWHVKLFH